MVWLGGPEACMGEWRNASGMYGKVGAILARVSGNDVTVAASEM